MVGGRGRDLNASGYQRTYERSEGGGLDKIKEVRGREVQRDA